MAVGALGFTLAALGVAWACTAQAVITSVSNYNPAAGEVIHVTGAEFYANADVAIKWGAPDGVTLATTRTVADEARGESVHGDMRATFAVDVTVPADATPGRHVLYALAPGANQAARAIFIPDEEPEPSETSEAPEAPELDEAPAPVDPPAQPEPAAVTPAPVDPPAQPEPAAVTPAPVEDISTEPEPAGVVQAVAPEPEPASSPAVLMNWRHTHGAMLNASATPVATPNMDWRHTHGALLHAVPASPESPDVGVFADAVTAAERAGYEWAGVPQQEPSGVGAGIGLLAVGLMLLFGGFTVAAVTRRREKVPVTGK